MPDDRRNKSRKTDFLVTGSFLMSVVIGLVVGYDQLRSKYADERFELLKKQNEAIDSKLDKMSDFLMDCKTDIIRNTERISAMWSRIKNGNNVKKEGGS